MEGEKLLYLCRRIHHLRQRSILPTWRRFEHLQQEHSAVEQSNSHAIGVVRFLQYVVHSDVLLRVGSNGDSTPCN